jgi:hypothetical protein
MNCLGERAKWVRWRSMSRISVTRRASQTVEVKAKPVEVDTEISEISKVPRLL